MPRARKEGSGDTGAEHHVSTSPADDHSKIVAKDQKANVPNGKVAAANLRHAPSLSEGTTGQQSCGVS